MFLNVLKQLKQIKEDYPEIDEFVFLIDGGAILNEYYWFDTFVYKRMYDSITHLEYRCGLAFYHCTQNIANFFITHGIYYIHCIPKYHKDGTPVFLVKFYNSKDLAALKILKYYRRYRYNLYKKRRDPLKKELMEYCYHPSRITF